ncbi:hypothetical protein DBR11_12815 [Pedobacter sp. HMWF019]|uniref:hypothetical protein n=1 Tax=Pedobacter sp. HMWF019 TaxID=2056856 RepID=UPI000D35250B|nr:hypothetical protein [Pedobacter sp. HMWF019]PTS99263.1 hypothetical protein DBR11_12815 [Pedobacter sp. HMWF019]
MEHYKKEVFIKKMRYFLCILLVLPVFSCLVKAQQKTSVKKGFSAPKGFGYRWKEAFEGIPFKLPDGIELREAIKGYSGFFPDSCQGITWENMKSEGALVGVCGGFRNKTKQAINVDLPPGLILISQSDETQHGILVEKLSVQIPSEQYLFAPKDSYLAAGAYCINLGRPGGGNPGFTYKFGPITTFKPLLDFFKLLEKKEKRVPGQVPDPMISAIIQGCIWNIISKGYLDKYNMEQFAKIPDKKK